MTQSERLTGELEAAQRFTTSIQQELAVGTNPAKLRADVVEECMEAMVGGTGMFVTYLGPDGETVRRLVSIPEFTETAEAFEVIKKHVGR